MKTNLLLKKMKIFYSTIDLKHRIVIVCVSNLEGRIEYKVIVFLDQGVDKVLLRNGDVFIDIDSNSDRFRVVADLVDSFITLSPIE